MVQICLILHWQFVNTPAQVLPEFSYVILVFFTFMAVSKFSAAFEAFFLCFEAWISSFLDSRTFGANFFCVYFWNLYLYTCLNKTLCIRKMCTYKHDHDFMFFVILPCIVFFVLDANFLIFQERNRTKSPYFLLTIIYLYCVCFWQ